jgi:thiamine pyrophosphate-dependent acetolactate synthase large subunit-like protein
VKPFFRVAPWDYVGIAESLGCRGVRVQSRAAFRTTFAEALRSRSVFLIEAALSPTDISPTWTRIADEVRSRLHAAPAGAKKIW